MTVHGAKGLEAKNVILDRHHDRAAARRLSAAPADDAARHAAPGAKRADLGARAKTLDVGPMSDARAGDARRGAQRIPAAALCRHDARRRAAGGVRDQGRQQNAGRLLVSTRRRRAQAALRAEDDRRRRRQGLAHAQRRDAIARRRSSRRLALPPAPPAWLGSSSAKHVAHARVHPRRPIPAMTKPRASPARGDRDTALRRGNLVSPAAAIAARHRAGAPRRGGPRVSRAARRDVDAEGSETMTSAGAGVARRSALRTAVRARQPRGSLDRRQRYAQRRAAKRRGQIDRLAVTDSGSADRRLQDQPPAAARESPTCRPAIFASSRSIAPCCEKFIRSKTVRAALIWTETPDLMELSQEVMDAALAHVTSA